MIELTDIEKDDLATGLLLLLDFKRCLLNNPNCEQHTMLALPVMKLASKLNVLSLVEKRMSELRPMIIRPRS